MLDKGRHIFITFSFRRLFIITFLLFLVVPAITKAEVCGGSDTSSTTDTQSCDNTFGRTTDESFSVVVNTVPVSDGDSLGIIGTSTVLFSIDAFPNYEHELYRQTSSGYEEVAIKEVSFSGADSSMIRPLVEQYFYGDEAADIDFLTQLLLEGGDQSVLDDKYRVGLNNIIGGIQSQLILKQYENIPIGTYVLVSTEQPLCMSEAGKRRWWESIFVQTAHACSVSDDVEIRTTAFTLDQLPQIEVEEEEIDPLLLKYAPILQFHENEMYFPMDVETFISDSALWKKGEGQIYNANELDAEEFSKVIDTVDTEDYYLAYSSPNDSGEINLQAAKNKYDTARANGEASSTIYVHKMTDTAEDGTEYIVLQYWFFYAMNNWGEQGGFNDHEGDWESVFVFLDKKTEDPKYVAFSAHLNDGNNEWYNYMQYDSVRRMWNDSDLIISDHQVNSYVALGSHANYPEPGTYEILTLLGKKKDSAKGSGKKISFETNLSLVESQFVHSFKGRWGTQLSEIGGDGPQGPQYIDITGQVRFDEPLEWAGINDIESTKLDRGSRTVTVANIPFRFATSSEDDVEITVSPHREPVTFGNFVEGVSGVLPVFWDIETPLTNEEFFVSFDLPYDSAWIQEQGVELSQLNGLYYNQDTDTWENASSTVSAEEEVVTISTDHFSRYAVGWTANSTSDNTVVATTTATSSTSDVLKESEQGGGGRSTAQYSVGGKATPQVAGVSTSTLETSLDDRLVELVASLNVLVKQYEDMSLKERQIVLVILLKLVGIFDDLDERSQKSIS